MHLATKFSLETYKIILAWQSHNRVHFVLFFKERVLWWGVHHRNQYFDELCWICCIWLTLASVNDYFIIVALERTHFFSG